jgi:hypothetical protein
MATWIHCARTGKVTRLLIDFLLISSTLRILLSASPPESTNNAFSSHIEKLPKLPGFTAVIQPPFVILGDESPQIVQRRATNTVKWATDKLKQDFFSRDPAEVIDIWLFKDNHSYTNYAWLLFKDVPTTRFGYFSAQNHALVMNISTGGGTLVHEMVHAFINANFPKCPPWFNEGFASLFEACEEKDGHLHGMINWRFKGLEKAIKEGKTISFQKLASMTSTEFYGEENYSQFYAQARYLCYYLQEKGLLVKYYREFTRNVNKDPTGFSSLQHVLGEKDMKAFQNKWEKFILELRNG